MCRCRRMYSKAFGSREKNAMSRMKKTSMLTASGRMRGMMVSSCSVAPAIVRISK